MPYPISVKWSVAAAVIAVSLAGVGATLIMAQNTGRQGPARRQLPADVYPESRFRLPLPKREELDEAGQRIYDATMSGERQTLAGLQGPTGIRLYSGKLAEAMSGVNNYLRRETDLDPKLTELAILVTAKEMDSQFEWTQHEIEGRRIGLSPTAIDLVKFGKPVSGVGEKEAVIIDFGREMMGKRKVSSGTFARALQAFGKKGLVDLTALMGHYASTSLLLTAFDMQLPPEQDELLPRK
jgi:4-carboxymuconolactone decarboxylase